MSTPTPPHLKWLLNERAMLAGELARFDERITKLIILRTRTAEKLAALGHTLKRLEHRLRPDAGGLVRAQRQYGARGALTDFIAAQLQLAVPAFLDTFLLQTLTAHAFDTRMLFELAVDRFELRLETAAERKRYCDNTFRPALRKLQSEGLVEAMPTRRTGRNVGEWRKTTEAQSLAALLSPARTESVVVADSPAARALRQPV